MYDNINYRYAMNIGLNGITFILVLDINFSIGTLIHGYISISNSGLNTTKSMLI